jgi:hypothetical protein
MSVQPVEAIIVPSNKATENALITEHRFAADSSQWCAVHHWTGNLNLIHGAALATFLSAPEGRVGDSAVGSILSYLSRNMDLMGKVPNSAVGHKMNEMMNWGKPGAEAPSENAEQHVFLSGSDFRITDGKVYVYGIGELPLTLEPAPADLNPVMIELFNVPVEDGSDIDSAMRVHYDRVAIPDNVISLF